MTRLSDDFTMTQKFVCDLKKKFKLVGYWIRPWKLILLQ